MPPAGGLASVDPARPLTLVLLDSVSGASHGWLKELHLRSEGTVAASSGPHDEGDCVRFRSASGVFHGSDAHVGAAAACLHGVVQVVCVSGKSFPRFG